MRDLRVAAPSAEGYTPQICQHAEEADMATKKVKPMSRTVSGWIFAVLDDANIKGRDAQNLLLMKRELRLVTEQDSPQVGAK